MDLGKICYCCVVNLACIKESSKYVCLYLQKMLFTIRKLLWSGQPSSHLFVLSSPLRLRDIKEHWAECTRQKIGKQLWHVSVTERDTVIVILQQLQLSILGLYQSWTSSSQICLRKSITKLHRPVELLASDGFWGRHN